MNSRRSDSFLAPTYIKIKNNIQHLITSGKYQPGDKLPSEAELSTAFKVSRITIRLALKELLNQGAIYSKQGKGSFVSLPTMSNISGFRSFSEDTRSKGLEPSSIILQTESILADEHIASHLKINANDPIFVLKRIRLSNNTPVVVEIAHIPLTSFPNFGDHEISNSIFQIFRGVYGVTPAWTDNQIQAIPASDEIASHLQIHLNDPVLKITCTDYTDSFMVIEYVVSYYCGNSYTFSTGRQSII
jgi:GntR family transcriptional regulator